jgi:Ti-type conjugative transfer relaxase TraA
VLSIGKMVVGSEAYYLSMVAEGREEYYTGAGEAPGTWVGSGIGALGLNGEVRPDDLRCVLDGTSPADGSAIARKRNDLRGRVAGFDLTFSAPKSASLLYGLGSPETAAAVRASHDRAVAEALVYLERHAVFARRGHDGANRIGTCGLVAAAFVHRTSRTGDPQLHTHVLAANAVLGDDGRWSAPDARLLYFHGRTAGFVYQASLRAGLVEALGVRFGLVRHGSAEVSGFEPSLLRGFSTRRAEIEEYLFLRGESSRRTAELAALATREPKARHNDISLDGVDLRERWRARALELGVDPDTRLYERGTSRRVTLRPEIADRIAGELLSPEGLTAQQSTFERRDVVRAIAEHLSEGAALEDIERLADQILRDAAVVELAVQGRGGEILVTTAELLELEAALLEQAEIHAGLFGPQVDRDRVRAVLSRHRNLSDEQRSMVERLATSGAGLEVVVGKAGAGKTTALSLAREAFEESGFEVTGTALSARAAEELKRSAGIASLTVARFLGEVKDGARILGPRVVLVLDEAGMVGTRDIAKLVDMARTAGAKLILVGDPRQLPEIAVGGAYGALAARLGAIELSENRRQRDAWERAALDHLRRGDAPSALATYDAHGRIHLASTIAQARADVVERWSQARASGIEAVMLAASRRDVDALNLLARIDRRRRRELGADVMVTESRSFAIGDEVVCNRNSRRIGVLNGTRGTVLGWSDRLLTIDTMDGLVDLPRNYIEAGHLDHGYATTIHKAQGATYERAFVLATEALTRESGYVAMSRARGGAELFVADGPFETGHGPDAVPDEPLAATANRLATSRAKRLASELLGTEPPRWIDPPRVQLLGLVGRHGKAAPKVPRAVDRMATDFSGPGQPPWVTGALGRRPAFVDEQARYDKIAAAITDYRRHFSIQGDDPLGERPFEARSRLAYDAVAEQIHAYERRRWRELDAPSLDTGLSL